MLNSVKKLITEKQEYLQTAAAIFEDGSGMNLDDLIVLKEDSEIDASDPEIEIPDDAPENEMGGDSQLPEDDENEEDESPVAIDNGDDNEDYNDDHDFMDDEIPDTKPNDNTDDVEGDSDEGNDNHNFMDDEIPDTDVSLPGDNNDLPTPVGAQTGLPITGDVDDLLSVDIDLKSNTTKDILPVPPAHAAEALQGDTLENKVDSGFGESTGDQDIDAVLMIYESYCNSCINNGLIPVDQFEFIENILITEGVGDAVAAKIVRKLEDPEFLDRMEKKALNFEQKIEKRLQKMDEKESKKQAKKAEKADKKQAKDAAKEQKKSDKLEEKEWKRQLRDVEKGRRIKEKLEKRSNNNSKNKEEKIERIRRTTVSDKKHEKLLEKQRKKEERALAKDKKKKHYMERVKVSLLEAFPDCDDLVPDEFLEEVIYEAIEFTGEDSFYEAITLDNGNTVEGNTEQQPQQNPAPAAPQPAPAAPQPQQQTQAQPAQPLQPQQTTDQNTNTQQPPENNAPAPDDGTPTEEVPDDGPVEAPVELDGDMDTTDEGDGQVENPEGEMDDTDIDGLDDVMDEEIPEDGENAVTSAVRDKIAEVDGDLNSDTNRAAVKSVMKKFNNFTKGFEDLRNDITDLM